MHDCEWQVCGPTYTTQMGCIHVDAYGRQYPSPQRFPSTAVNATHVTWKPLVDRAHAQGIAFGIHLMHGVPKITAAQKRPILGSSCTTDEIVAKFSGGETCATFIPDLWTTNAPHPGTQNHYDIVVAEYAHAGIDFLCLGGILGTCEGNPGVLALTLPITSWCATTDATLTRLRSSRTALSAAETACSSSSRPVPGVHIRARSPIRAAAPSRTRPKWLRTRASGRTRRTPRAEWRPVHNGATNRTIAPLLRPHHFGELASLMVGKVHGGRSPTPGPDCYIPSSQSKLNEDEVCTFASMVAIFRSSWWPAGVLRENGAFAMALLTNDAVIRVGMASKNTRQVAAGASHLRLRAGPGIVWTSDDEVNDWKCVLLGNCGAAHANIVKNKKLQQGVGADGNDTL